MHQRFLWQHDLNEIEMKVSHPKDNHLKDIDSTNCKPEDYLPPPSRNSLFIAPILAQEIVNTIKCIKGKVSTDINEVSTALLKSVAWQISAPLEHIFNLSIDQGFMPDNMKLSKTVPVFNKNFKKF